MNMPFKLPEEDEPDLCRISGSKSVSVESSKSMQDDSLDSEVRVRVIQLHKIDSGTQASARAPLTPFDNFLHSNLAASPGLPTLVLSHDQSL